MVEGISKINKEEEEKAEKALFVMQKEMGIGREAFFRLYTKLKDRLNPEDQEALKRIINEAGEAARELYLEAVKSNPANLLVDALRKLDPTKDIALEGALSTLEKNVLNIAYSVKVARGAAASEGRDSSTRELLTSKVFETDSTREVLRYGGENDLPRKGIASDENMLMEILNILGAYPGGEMVPMRQLREVLKTSKNKKNSGRPYWNESSNSASELKATMPGFEGLKAEITFGSTTTLFLDGDVDFWTRVIDMGQFIPYTAEKK